MLIREDGVILQIFKRGEKPPSKVDYRIDGRGRTVIPGLVDSHAHVVAMGFAAVALDLSDAASLAEAQAKIAAYSAKFPDRPWIVGGAAVVVGSAALLALGGSATLWRAGLLAAAMGALNTLFLADGRARVATTYSTGTLVSLGLALASLVTGGSRTAWRRPLLLWAALVTGAVVGALAHRAGSTVALALASAALGACALILARQRR